MSCREALLVLLDPAPDDGPSSPSEGSIATTTRAAALRRARVHAATCQRCAASYHDPAAPPQVMERLSNAMHEPAPALRWLLLVLAIAQVVVACPWLFGASLIPDRNVTLAHLTRDGAFGLVAACCAFIAAWRPRHTVATLLVGTVVLLAQFSAGFVDEQQRSVNTAFEATHLLMFVILGLLAFAASSSRFHPHDDAPRPPTLHSL
jgi:hypothetical protein